MYEQKDDKKETKVTRFFSEFAGYKRTYEEWFNRCDFILSEYTNSKHKVKSRINHGFNILWANHQTMRPSLYARLPKPEISRRFDDKDPVGRITSELLERCVRFNLDEVDADYIFRSVVDDYALLARGVLWVRYNYKDKSTGEYEEDEKGNKKEIKDLDFEKVEFDYVGIKDFGHSYAKRWEDVEMVWRTAYMSKDAFKDRFGEDKVKDIQCNSSDSYNYKSDNNVDKNKYCVYEIWHKPSRKVYWITEGYDEFLDEKEDFLNLKNFFPCPKPLYSTITNESLEPIPDYILCRSQIQQLNILTNRITKLIRNVRVVGTYDSSSPAIRELFDDTGENKLVAVTNWSSFAGKGGLKGAIDIIPIVDFANCIKILYEGFEQQKQQIYEITGMSDLIRGQNNANATATAEELKSNYATVRFKDRRDAVSKFLRDSINIMVEIIANKFDKKTFKLMSNLKLCDDEEQKQQLMALQQEGQELDEKYIKMIDEPTWDEIIKFIRDDELRTFRIDVETDSTVITDEAKEKIEALEFTKVIGSFMKEAVPAAQANPQLAPLLGEMFIFLGNKYKGAKTMVGLMENLVEQLNRAAKNPAPKQPDPEMIKLQAEQQALQVKMQFDAQMKDKELQNALILDERQGQREMQIKQMEAELKARLDANAQQQQTLDSVRTSEIEIEKDNRLSMLQAEIEQLRQDNENLRHQSKEENANYREELKNNTQKELALFNASNTKPQV